MDTLPELSPFQRRLDELSAQMAAPSFYANLRRAADVTREQQKLGQLVADYQAYEKVGIELGETRALAQDPAADPAFRNSRRRNWRAWSAAGPRSARPCCSR